MAKLYGNEHGTGNKKCLNILILEILKRYSDEEHHLTQQEIMRKLKSDYGIEKTDRRTVRANVESLANLGYEIYGVRDEDDEDDADRAGYYLIERDFEDAELRLLIDSVLFSKTISEGAARRLVDKLRGFGNIYFDTKVSHVKPTPVLHRTDNKVVLVNVSEINEAMDQKKKIRFRYNKYGIDFKMHDQGKEYIMNPYQMVASNGHYYLLGNVDKYDDVSYYRIDKMFQVEIMKEKIKPQKEVKGLEGHLNLPKHMAEHIYMLVGDTVRATLKTDISMMDTLVDWFGKDFKIVEAKGDELTISVNSNERALFYWALQYGQYVEVTAPEYLRKQLSETIDEMSARYHR